VLVNHFKDIDKHVEQGLNISGKSKKHKEKSKVSKQAGGYLPVSPLKKFWCFFNYFKAFPRY